MIDSLLRSLRRGDVFISRVDEQAFFTCTLYMRKVRGVDVIFGGNLAESRRAVPITDSNDLDGDDYVVCRVREFRYAQPTVKLNLFSQANVAVREEVADSFVFVSADQEHALRVTPAMVFLDADRVGSFVPDDDAGPLPAELFTLIRAQITRAEKNMPVKDARKDSTWYKAAREGLTPREAGLVK